ncbi:MAG: hypothetical protein HRT44_04945 [Bdellovibrionales bacterium]|nr:hypothetical protein [Bdellovibrionales bacterium]NQZ18588.1 hypothetical protein [Bdellovibrionales bacterium]
MRSVSFLNSNKGSALLVVAAITSAVAITLSYFGQSMISQSKMSNNVQSLLDEEIVLNSILDYTMLGIQQNWCFTTTWLREAQCDLAHPRSVERLLLTSKSIDAIQEQRTYGVPINVGTPITLTRIEQDVAVDAFTNQHPLSTITAYLKDANVQSISISIQKLENDIIQSKGTEVYLRVKVALTKLTLGAAANRSIESTLAIFPRELSTFGLVVANNLYLGKAAGSKPGDSAIPAGDETSSGIIFDSPIYVNGDINLMTEKYTPVTFTDNVVLGTGVLKKGGKPYTPESLGGKLDRYYSDMEGIGGFKRGLSLMGKRDDGLDYFSGLKVGNKAKSELMEDCIRMSLAGSDLFMTSRSTLGAKLISNNNSGGRHRYRLGLSSMNLFNEQDGIREDVTKATGRFRSSDFTGKTSSRSIAEVEIKIGDDHYVEATLNDNNTLEVKPKYHNIDKPEQKLNNAADRLIEVNDGIYSIVSENQSSYNRLSDINRELSSINDKIHDLNDKIDDDIDEPERDDFSNGPSGAVKYGLAMASYAAKMAAQKSYIDRRNSLRDEKSALNGEKSGIKSDIAAAEKEKKKFESEKKDLEEVIPTYQSAVEEDNHPPGVEITLRPQMMGQYDQFNQRELDINIKNQDQFKANSIDIDFKAFDAGTEKGKDKRKYSGKDQTGYKGYSRKISFDFDKNSSNIFIDDTKLQSSRWIANNSTETIVQPVEAGFNYGELEKKCEDPASGVSFETASWDISFAEKTRASWTFADPTDKTWNITSLDAGTNPDFKVRSIVNKCVVQPDAINVVGFLACDEFIILSRSTPLNIMGTIIAGKVSIAPKAVAAGIWWSSIYHPQAVKKLREAQVLKPVMGGECSELTDPIWHPNPSLVNLSNHYKCSPISLREKANPFTWSAVDPDCGIIDENSNRTSCKFRAKNYFIYEIGRGFH